MLWPCIFESSPPIPTKVLKLFHQFCLKTNHSSQLLTLTSLCSPELDFNPKWIAVPSAHSRLSHAFRLNCGEPQIRGGLAVVGSRKGYVPNWEWTEGFSSAGRSLLQQKFQVKIKLLYQIQFSSVQFSRSVVSDSLQLHDCSTPGLPVYHKLLESTQTHVYCLPKPMSIASVMPSNILSSPSPPALSLSQHQGLFQWVSSSHQVAKVLEFQLQYQSLQWIFRTDLL